jgi:hypothetical protein
MCRGAPRRLCNPSKSCHVRKVARLLAQSLRNNRCALWPTSSHQWLSSSFFHPDGYDDDVLVVGSTSMAQSPSAKAMEWARRILGKSNATDMKWGKDIRKEMRPVVNWGHALFASPSGSTNARW